MTPPSMSRGRTKSTSVGTVANIVQSLKLPDGNIKVLVEGVERGKIISVSEDEGYFRAAGQDLQFQSGRRAAAGSAGRPRHRACSNSTSS